MCCRRSLSSMRRITSPVSMFLAVYALLYAAFGVQSPFLPALLQERGLHAEEIGIVLAASTAIRVLAGPMVGHAADRLREHTLTLCACALAAAVAGLGYVTIRGFGGLLIVGLIHAAMLAPIVPISDALATTAAQESETGEGRRFEYGWLRASGSAAFIVGTLLSGWGADQAGLASIVWISGSLLVTGGGRLSCCPVSVAVQPVPGRMRVSALRDCALLLRIAVFRRILLVAALIEGSHALNDTFAVIRWRAAGVSLPTVSVLWSESVLSEVLVFLLIGPRLIRQIGPGGACALAAGAGVIRWSVLAFTTSPILLGLVQPLHGADIRAAALGVHARDCAGGAAPSGSDGAIDLRNLVYRTGYRSADPGLWRAVRANGRPCVPRHGRALPTGAAHVCRAPVIKGTGMLSLARTARSDTLPRSSSLADCLLSNCPWYAIGHRRGWRDGIEPHLPWCEFHRHRTDNRCDTALRSGAAIKTGNAHQRRIAGHVEHRSPRRTLVGNKCSTRRHGRCHIVMPTQSLPQAKAGVGIHVFSLCW